MREQGVFECACHAYRSTVSAACDFGGGSAVLTFEGMVVKFVSRSPYPQKVS